VRGTRLRGCITEEVVDPGFTSMPNGYQASREVYLYCANSAGQNPLCVLVRVPYLVSKTALGDQRLWWLEVPLWWRSERLEVIGINNPGSRQKHVYPNIQGNCLGRRRCIYQGLLGYCLHGYRAIHKEGGSVVNVDVFGMVVCTGLWNAAFHGRVCQTSPKAIEHSDGGHHRLRQKRTLQGVVNHGGQLSKHLLKFLR